MLTPYQVAKLLQMSRAKVYRLLEEGGLPGARKIGSEWRIYAPSLHQWLDGRWPHKKSAEACVAPAQIARTS